MLGKEALLDRGIALFANAQSRQTRVCLAVLQDALYSPIGREGIMVHAGYSVLVLGDPRSTGEMLGIISKDANTCFVVAILASLPDGRIACVVSHLGENAPLGDPDESDLVLATLGPLVQIMIEGLGVPKNNILVVPINKRSERGSRYMSKVCSFFDEQRIAYERDFIDAVGVARTGVRVDMRARVVEAMGRKALRVSPRQERWTTIGRKALRSVPSVRRAGPLDAAVLRSAALYTKLSTIADSLIEIVVEDPAEAVGIIRRMYHENPALDIMIKAIVNEKRKVAVLDRIADPRIRFNEQGYVQRRVVPDGRGGYLIDTVAPEGSWDVQIGGERPEEVTSVSVLCAIDALSDIIFNQRRPQSYGAFERGRLSADKEKVIRLCIVDSLSASAADTGRRALFYSEEHPDVAVATADDGTCTFFMSRLFIEGSRPQMRRDMRAAFARFAEHPIPERVAGMPIAVPSLEFSSSAQVSTVMMAETGALGLGGNIVRHAIEAQGTPVLKVDPAQWPALVSDPILLLTVEQTNVLEVREITRSFKKKYPGGRIIAGGSFISNQFKAAIALLPGIDIFIRGEGEDVLPGVVAAIKGADRGAVYSLEALKALTSNGGIFARSPRRMLLHRLDRVNEAEDIEIPVLDYPDLPFMHQEAWNIDRGCPHECGFCDICMGTRLRYAKLEKLKGHLIARLALSLRVGLFDHLEALRSDERNLVTDPVSGFTRPVSFNGYTHRQVETIIRSADEVLRAYGLSGYTSTVCAGLAQRIHLSPASAASLETFIAALPERVTVTQAREILLAGQCLLVDDLLEKKMDLTAFGATVSDGFPVRYSEIDYSGFVAAMMADAPFRERVLNETRMRLGLPDDRSDRTVIIRYAIEIINTFLERSDPLSFPVAAEAPDGKFDREMRYMRAAFLRAGGRLTDAERITFNRAFLQKHCPGILGPHPKKLKQVFFGDNAFGRKDRVRALCEWIKAMGLDAYFQLGAFDVTIPSLLVREPGAAHAVPDEGFIRLLKEAGFTGLYGIGYDGRTNELLRQLGKIRTGSGEPSYQVFQVLQINDLLWRIGIDADYHQMYGTPYSGIKRDGGKGQGIADILEGVLLAAMTSVDYNAHAVYVWSMLGSEITNRFIVEHPEEFDFGRPGTPCSWYPDENGVAAIKLIDNGAYGDTYGMTMIPPAHPEYLLLGQRPMRCENPAGRRVLEAFRDITQPYQEPDRVFEIARDYPEDLEEVIQGWLSPEQSDTEMRALGVLVERYDTGSGRLDALLRIHHDMRERRIHLFEKFLQRMMEGDPAALREHADSAVLRPTAYAQTSRYRLDRIRAEIDRLDGERRAWNESDLRKHRGILSYLRLLDKEESVVVAEHMIERAMDPKFPPCEVNHDMTGDIYELCRDDERWFLIFAERLAVLMIRYADNPRSHQPFKEIALHLIAISRQDPARFPLAVFMEKIPSDTCMLFLRAPIIDQIGVSDESGIDVWCDRKSGLRLRSFGHEHHFMMTMLTDIGEHPAAYVTLHREPLTGMSQALFVDVLPVMNAGTETGRIALRQLAIWLQQRAGPGGYIVSQYPVHEFMIYFFLQTLLHNGAIERLEAGLLDMNVLNSAVVLRAGVWDEVTTRRDIRRCFPKVAGQYLFLRGTVPHEAPQHIDGRYRADAV
ncbi:MAG: hypothetical protein WCG78_04840 [Candidatus Omnitrophota bacterium]